MDTGPKTKILNYKSGSVVFFVRVLSSQTRLPNSLASLVLENKLLLRYLKS